MMIHISQSQIQEALVHLGQGGAIIFPTDTVYGLGCKSTDGCTMGRIFTLKKRPLDRPLQLLLSDPGQVASYAVRVPTIAKQLMERYWPGALTVLLPAAESLPQELTGLKGKVGVRVPDLPPLQELISRVGGALAATSANLSGQKSPWSVEEIPRRIQEEVEFTIDAGRLEATPASTVIDCAAEQPRLLRRGAIEEQALERFGVKI